MNVEIIKKEIEDISELIRIYENTDFAAELVDEDVEEVISNMNTIKSALEKQIPKKPVIKKSIKTNAFELRCPNCEVPLQADTPHCKICGQALDWSDTE